MLKDLNAALFYARSQAEDRELDLENRSYYDADVFALEAALYLLKKQFGTKYDDCHWFWRKDWEPVDSSTDFSEC